MKLDMKMKNMLSESDDMEGTKIEQIYFLSANKKKRETEST